jgi:hypothetical protein
MRQLCRAEAPSDSQCRGAEAIAREYLGYDVVLKRLLADVGL